MVVPVEGAGAVEEFEVEGGGGLAVDFSAGTGLHGHFSVLFFWVGGGCNDLGGGAGLEYALWCHC